MWRSGWRRWRWLRCSRSRVAISGVSFHPGSSWWALPCCWPSSCSRGAFARSRARSASISSRSARHASYHGYVATSIPALYLFQPVLDDPVGYVTNGVHVSTFMRQAWAKLLNEYLGDEWRDNVMDPTFMGRILDIPEIREWYAAWERELEYSPDPERD